MVDSGADSGSGVECGSGVATGSGVDAGSGFDAVPGVIDMLVLPSPVVGRLGSVLMLLQLSEIEWYS